MSDRLQASPAATWERIIVAAIFLSLIPLPVVNVPFITFMLGIAIFLVYRRDYRYLTYHSLLAALWQLSFYIMQGVFHAQLYDIGLRLRALLVSNPKMKLQWFFFNPGQWGHLSPMEQLVMTIVLASMVLNLVIALWGAARTLYGREVRMPVLSHLCEKMMPAVSR